MTNHIHLIAELAGPLLDALGVERGRDEAAVADHLSGAGCGLGGASSAHRRDLDPSAGAARWYNPQDRPVGAGFRR